jgi:hypothetical protein
MVTREFISELEKIRDLFEWSLEPTASRGVERRSKPRLRLRGRLKQDLDNTKFDPIGAVCYAKTKLVFGEDYWVESGITVGLPVQEARDLVAAANDSAWRQVGDHREPDPYRQTIRDWLIRAVGLSAERTNL